MRLRFDVPNDPTRYDFVHHLRARFAETDAMGIVHHAAYLPWLEEARAAFLRDRGHPYQEIRAEGIDLSVLEVATQYRSPARFDDVVAVHVRVPWVKAATFQVDYLLTVDDRTCVLAATVHGAVDPTGRPARTPPWLRSLLAADAPAGARA